eukprot:TRINITY_DN15928_c0_g1_i1.p1 TRINITY_DN15928_c0_g1~~TRINITY_DN15928_c0_g1_i1.p1  ORF type:complete len:610 (+),score=106.88 TRINITY_DN15928_c0_g1_i1:68-1897(+)
MDITVESEAEWLVRHGLGHLRRLVPEAVPTSLSLGRNAQIGAQVHGDHGSGELLGWRFRGDRFGDTTGGQPERDGDCKVKLEDGSVCVVPAADLCLTRQADAEDADPVRPPTPPSPLKAPECADLFMKFPLVPGRGVGRHCSPMWVRLVESLGIAVGMPKFRHASWEEHAGVKDGSRYVPTVLLFALRNATAIRRLQNSKVVSRAELNELLDHLTTLTPVSQDPDEQELGLLTPATMTALCGPAAGALTERLREIVLRYRNSKDRLDIAEFALVLRHEHQGLERHRAAVAEKSRLQRRKGEADSALVKHMHMFDAARGSLGDVDLATAAAALPSSMSLRDLLTDPDQAGLRPGQLVVVAVVQLCAAMSLLIEAPRHRDDADPLIAPELPHPSLRPPTIPDQAYWAQLQHLNGTDLLLSLPPFQHGMLAEVSCALPGDGGETWRHLVDCIVNDAGAGRRRGGEPVPRHCGVCAGRLPAVAPLPGPPRRRYPPRRAAVEGAHPTSCARPHRSRYGCVAPGVHAGHAGFCRAPHAAQAARLALRIGGACRAAQGPERRGGGAGCGKHQGRRRGSDLSRCQRHTSSRAEGTGEPVASAAARDELHRQSGEDGS